MYALKKALLKACLLTVKVLLALLAVRFPTGKIAVCVWFLNLYVGCATKKEKEKYKIPSRSDNSVAATLESVLLLLATSEDDYICCIKDGGDETCCKMMET